MRKDDFISSVLKNVYMYKGHPTVWNHLHSHQVSVFFFVLAVGASYVEEATAQATAEKYAALADGKASKDIMSLLVKANASANPDTRLDDEELWAQMKSVTSPSTLSV